jgi:hypothetical protein
MEQWWLAILPMAGAALGYIAKRSIERGARSEAIKRRLGALALLRGLRREQITMADLDQVERDAAMRPPTLPKAQSTRR